MTYRRRLLLAVAGAVAVTAALVSIGAYVATRAELRSGVDDALKRSVARLDEAGVDVRALADSEFVRAVRPHLGGPEGVVQLVTADGEVERLPRGRPVLPVGTRVAAVARGERGSFFSDVHVGDTHMRVYVAPHGGREAIQVGRSLEETDEALGRMAVVAAVVGALGVVGALLVGAVLARTLLRPVRRLTVTAEDIARTQHLDTEIEAHGHDELARMARAFNAMLRALRVSRRAQQDLVADASHELRTPLTALRSNLELLAEGDSFRPDDHRDLLVALAGQTQELSTLVDDLVELGRNGIERDERTEIRLDELVDLEAARARRRFPGAELTLRLEPTEVDGSPARLARAISNLLHNAHEWGPPGGPIEVTLRDGRLSVRDFGPGIAEEDLARVFERFYRPAAARGRPGSGLGLAIVRQAAESHGGVAYAENAAGGGARLTIDLSAVTRGRVRGSAARRAEPGVS
jgi:two-component system, OmpR family, sensor histidine kinase MprB